MDILLIHLRSCKHNQSMLVKFVWKTRDDLKNGLLKKNVSAGGGKHEMTSGPMTNSNKYSFKEDCRRINH